MKRTPLKRKTPLRKQGKTKISVLQRKIWQLCKEIIRKRYGNVCYTCGAKNLSGANWHTGHLFPKAALGAYLKYDLRVLRPQCYHCNINLGGNGALFYKLMLEREGIGYLNTLEADRSKSVQAMDHYLKILSEYEEILKKGTLT